MRRFSLLLSACALAIAAAAPAGAATPVADGFDQGSLEGWTAPGARPPTPDLLQPGPSGQPADFYLRVQDRASTAGIPGLHLIAPAAYRGDYRRAASRCGRLELDVRVFDDQVGSWLPNVVFTRNLPSGPLRARFQGAAAIDDSTAWHHLVIPLGPAYGGSGPLPSNASGAWAMLDGASNSQWNALLAQVDEVSVPLEINSGTFELFGFDNFALVYDDGETAPDCNGNGEPDSCDLAAGALDGNGNAVPDECESACAAPPADMRAWWTFDDPPALSTVADSAGSHDGVFANGATRGAGKVGLGGSFGGGGASVVVPESNSLDFGAAPGGDFSIDFWIRTTSDSGVQTLIDKRENVNAPAGYSVALVNGRPTLQLATGNGSAICSGSTSPGSCTNYVSTFGVADGLPNHVAVTVDRSETTGGRWYLNGMEVTASVFNPTARGGSLENNGTLLIGRQRAGWFGSTDFVGVLDEIEIFGRVLRPEEVRAIYEAGADGKCALAVEAPWDQSLCLNDDSRVVTVQVCNQKPTAQLYDLTFSGKPADGVLCHVDGPTVFSLVPPATEPLLVPADSCRPVGVRIGRPAFLPPYQASCFQVAAHNLADGDTATDVGSIYSNNAICCFPIDNNPFDLQVGAEVPVRFAVTNTAAQATLFQFEFEAMRSDMGPGAPAVSLAGGAPGEPALGEVQLDPGETAAIEVGVEALAADPFDFTSILLRDRNRPVPEEVLSSASVRGVDRDGCAADDSRLCLNGSRFEVRVAWEDFQGGSGGGTAVPLTGDTGYFWFFSDTNVELVLKVLDGRPINGHWWVFFGALSNVEYVITVTDVETGASRTYVNPAGAFASRGDTEAFPAPGAGVRIGSGAGGAPAPVVQDLAAFADAAAGGDGAAEPPISIAAPGGACSPTGTALCLNDSRFRVEVEWKDFQGGTGSGTAVPLTGDTGYFWFFRDTNVELILKVLDGRPVNGRWWVFYGALSNVEYTITVTDTETGQSKTYVNPSSEFASRGDTEAFPGSE